MAGGGQIVETRTIEMVSESERHGAPRNQFTLWFGANLQITAVVDGALAIVFGAEALTAIVGLLIGNMLGGIVMALHSAQGPRLGLPQMISSRAQFGVKGATLPLILVVDHVPGLRRHRHRAVRPGHQPACSASARRRSASSCSASDGGRRRRRLQADPHRRPHRHRRRHRRLRLSGDPAVLPLRHLASAFGQKPFSVAYAAADGGARRRLAADLRALRGRLLALPAVEHDE